MKLAICACLFVFACKGESKPAEPAAADKPTPTERETARGARPRPALPDNPGFGGDDGRPRPQLPDDERRRERRDRPDWNDPAAREEMRAMREERRKQREAELDTNNDGVLSDEERQQRMVPMHTKLDANNDGKVTPDELASSERRRMRFADPAAVDTDNNGEISLAELEAAVKARRDERRARWRGRGGGSGHAGQD